MKNFIKQFSFFLLGIFLTSFILISIWSFIPVGRMNNDYIFNYQLQERYRMLKSNTIKNIAKDKIFFYETSKIGINANEDEIKTALDGSYERYGGKEELETLLIDTVGDLESLKNNIKKEIISKKMIEHFQKQGDGNEKYAEFIKQIEEKTKIIIY